VLLAPTIGAREVTVVNALLAIALTLRGAQVTLLQCDGALGACERMTSALRPGIGHLVQHGPDRRNFCWSCYQPAARFFRELGLPLWTFRELLDVDSPIQDGSPPIDLREHALAGTLRYYKRGDLEGQPYASEMLARYTESAAVTVRAVRECIARLRPEVAVFHHGIYVPQGIIGEVCRAAAVHVVNWRPASRRNTFVFSHHDTYHRTMPAESAESWLRMPWTERHRQLTLEYLSSRRVGSNDWRSLARDATHEPETIIGALGLDRTRPIYCLLTNVMWDARVHFPTTAFGTQLEWLQFTLEWFARRPELQLVVRIHPGETSGSLVSCQPVADEIRRFMPVRPPNIYVVPPQSRLSTYTLAELSDATLIFGTKTGIELAAIGIPIVVAGEAWIRNKGISIDVSTPEEYRRVLESFPLGRRLDADTRDRALRFAYHIFFRRMIVVRSITERRFNRIKVLDFSARQLSDFERGADSGLDVICEGILQRRPFTAQAALETELA
jgi:hypothetical protein